MPEGNWTWWCRECGQPMGWVPGLGAGRRIYMDRGDYEREDERRERVERERGERVRGEEERVERERAHREGVKRQKAGARRVKCEGRS
jgi:hypothetical protein